MDRAHLSELIKATPLKEDRTAVISPFDGHERRTKCCLAEDLHRIITLSLECFNAWLSPFLSHSRKETVSSVQDHDPYLESLLRALHGHKWNIKDGPQNT